MRSRRLGSIVTLAMLAACSDNNRSGATPTDAAPRLDGSASDAATRADADTTRDAAAADAVAPADASEDAGVDSGSPLDAEPADTGPEDAGMVPFQLTSLAFTEGGAIPARHACTSGVDLQPELSWTGVPAGTQSFALVLIDDTIDFVHWVAYDLPPTTTSLAEGASDNSQLPTGTREANAYCRRYCGPCPPNQHTYTFRIYALDVAMVPFNLSGAFGDAELDATFDPHSLGMATLTGTYTP